MGLSALDNLVVRRAKRFEISKINELVAKVGMQTIDQSYINHRDVGIIAEYDNKIIGFLWLGLMRQNKLCYIDYFIVDKAFEKKGVGKSLAQFALEIASKMGVDQVFGIIANGESHDKSAFNALRMALSSDGNVYTQIKGHMRHVLSELRSK